MVEFPEHKEALPEMDATGAVLTATVFIVVSDPHIFEAIKVYELAVEGETIIELEVDPVVHE